MTEDHIDRIAGCLSDARSVTVLTGAGASAASGVPTFRGAGGLWRQFRAEDLATAAAFARDPALVWEWYDWRRSLISQCQPNRAHEVLAAWSRRLPGFHLITQNVDGLHERAATEHVTRLHGSIWSLRCWDDCGRAPWTNTATPLDPLPPRCASCDGLARPGVVWFGERLDPRDVARADAATHCDVLLVVGTSAVVYPAAGMIGSAKSHGAFVVEINPEATDATRLVDVAVQKPAEQALSEIDARM